MANYIKIFNDTVLKQSILQGYQAQRTNTNLGSFTMGQLAFTRDTGRVFVGNEGANQEHKDNDASPVQGGILVGNKYLGMIDSKPLGHYSPNSLPLKYGSHNISEASIGDNFRQEENGVLLNGSFHRKDRQKHWSKDVDYIEKYDAYTGDYMFDIFNNAFILFDKNINPDLPQPQYADSLQENKQTFKDAQGNIIPPEEAVNVTRRTKIIDNSDGTNENLYPIYGDGYVVMRILEPDGVTLDYKPRAYTLEGFPRTDQSTDTKWDNWSHNLIELKNVPAQILMASMSEDNFYNADGYIKLNPHQIGVKGFSADSFILPQKITFATNYNFINEDGNITMKDENGEKLNAQYPMTLQFGTGIETNQTVNDFVLSVTKTQEDNNTDYVVRLAQPYRQSFTVQLKDGLLNPITGETSLYLNLDNERENLLAIGFNSDVVLRDVLIGSNDPFYKEYQSNYYYHGAGYFNTSGNLTASETWDQEYKNYAKEEIQQFDSESNSPINYLKKPVNICWSFNTGTSVVSRTAYLEYLIKPYLFCVNKSYTQQWETTVDENNNPVKVIIEDWDKTVAVLGNNSHDDILKQSEFTFIDGFNASPSEENPFKNFTNTSSSVFKSGWVVEEVDTQGIITSNWKTTLKTSTEEQFTKIVHPVNLEKDTEQNLIDAAQQPLIHYTPKTYTARDIDANEQSDTDTAQKEDIYEGTSQTNKVPNFQLIPSIFSVQYDLRNDEVTIGNRYRHVSARLDVYLEKNEKIKKIEVSTNKEDERLLTWFDTSWVKIATGVDEIFDTPNEIITNFTKNFASTKYQKFIDLGNGLHLISNKPATEEVINFFGITNSPIFTNSDNIPYYLKVTTDLGVKYIKLQNSVELKAPKITKVAKSDNLEDYFYILYGSDFVNDQGNQSKELFAVTLSTISTINTGSELIPLEDVVRQKTLLISDFVNEIYTEGIVEEVNKNGISYTLTHYNPSEILDGIMTQNEGEGEGEETTETLSYKSLSFLTMSVGHTSAQPFYKYINDKSDEVLTVLTSAFDNVSDKISEQLCQIKYDNSFYTTTDTQTNVIRYNVDAKDFLNGDTQKFPLVNSDASIRFRQRAFVVEETIKDETGKEVVQEVIKYEFCGTKNIKYGIEQYPLQKEKDTEIGDESYAVQFDENLYQDGKLIIRQKETIDISEIKEFQTLNIPYFVWSTNEEATNLINATYTEEEGVAVLIPETDIEYGIISTDTYILKNTPRYKDGYVYPTSIKEKVIIPDNASSVILEIHKAINTTSPLSIYTAKDKESLAKNPIDQNVQWQSPAYSFPFIEVLSDSGQITDVLLSEEIISSNEKIVYSSSSKGVQTVQIPLIRTKLNKSKGFCFRINNISTSPEDKLVIRIIGYRA